MVYLKNLKKKGKGKEKSVCTETGPPPDDISSTCLKAMNWYEQGMILSPIRNQREAVVCWCIAISTTTEAIYNIRNPDRKRQGSPQHLIDNTVFSDSGLTRSHGVWNYVKQVGLCRIADYKTNDKLQQSLVKLDVTEFEKMRITSFKELEDKDVKDKQVIILLNQGPVVATVKAYPSFCEWKETEDAPVFMGPTTEDLRVPGTVGEHAVVLVGYGPANTEGVPHFICMNSAGYGWGRGGFGKIARSIGSNSKTLLTSISYCV